MQDKDDCSEFGFGNSWTHGWPGLIVKSDPAIHTITGLDDEQGKQGLWLHEFVRWRQELDNVHNYWPETDQWDCQHGAHAELENLTDMTDISV